MSSPCGKCGGTVRTKSGNCLPCKKVYDREYRKKHAARLREYGRDWSLRRRHGLTREQWHEMLVAQAGRCGICAEPFRPEWQAIHVDHCHETGRLRGLLCAGCNKALGRFGDSLDGVMRVVDYLKGATA